MKACIYILAASITLNANPLNINSYLYGPTSDANQTDSLDLMAGIEINQLIDQLCCVSKAAVGFSPNCNGSCFIIYPDSLNISSQVTDEIPLCDCIEIEKIVKFGYRAVPYLAKHISDGRLTRLPWMKGQMWTVCNDNIACLTETSSHSVLVPARMKDPRGHKVTVGDLCFVALGQIVNKSYSACEYMPTGGLCITSPTHSYGIADSIRKEFSIFDRNKHIELLVHDLIQFDSPTVRKGAYYRLSFFFPELLDKIMFRQLCMPAYNSDQVDEFVKNILYKEIDTTKKLILVRDFIHRTGKVNYQGIAKRLFSDLKYQELNEAGHFNSFLSPLDNPRLCLVDIFGYPHDINTKSFPVPSGWSTTEMADLINSMSHDKSVVLDNAIFIIYLIYGVNNPEISDSCKARLVERSYKLDCFIYTFSFLNRVIKQF